MLEKVKEESESKGLSINVQKTKWLVMTKDAQVTRGELRCGGRLIERVENFNYLGSVVSENVKCDT